MNPLVLKTRAGTRLVVVLALACTPHFATAIAVDLERLRRVIPHMQVPTIGRQADLGNLLDPKNVTRRALSQVLYNELPIRLDAASAFPTVASLPGGPFQPTPLELTTASLQAAMAPGDYTMQVYAFSMQDSVQQPGRGVAYLLAPMRGKAATAVGSLIWRGLAIGLDPRHLRAVTCSIQSGLSYPRMPKSHQQTIDLLIPEMRSQLDSNLVEQLESTYWKARQVAPSLPPLEDELRQLGPSGESAIRAMRQQAILRRQDIDEQRRTAILVGKSESSVYVPVNAENGPWTVLTPGVAYIRLSITGGSMSVNRLEVRIVQPYQGPPFQGDRAALPTPMDLFGAKATARGAVSASGLVGYAVFQPSEALNIYPVAAR